jgi:multidrug resistance efflux pump
VKSSSRIPLPRRYWWREFRIRALPPIMCGIALVALALSWRDYVGQPAVLGQVQGVQAVVASPQAGVLTKLRVGFQQMVTTGEVLGQVITTPAPLLAAHAAVVRAELDLIRAGIDPLVTRQERNALAVERLRLELLCQKVDVATAQVEFDFAEAEYARLDRLHSATPPLAADAEFEKARRNRDSLKAQLEQRRSLIESTTERLHLEPGSEHSSDKLAQATRAAIALQDEKLRLLETQSSPVILVAPCDGIVSKILRHSGEAITAGEPILTIKGSEALRVSVYLNEPRSDVWAPGGQVRIRTRDRQRKSSWAQILTVGSQLERIPVNLALNHSVNSSLETGLPIAITAPRDLRLVPGELVDVSWPSTTYANR